MVKKEDGGLEEDQEEMVVDGMFGHIGLSTRESTPETCCSFSYGKK